MGDIYRFRNLYTQLKALRHKNDTIAHLIENLQKEQLQHNEDINKFTWETVAVREWLIAAKVCSQIAPLLSRLAVKGVIPDFIYPQYSPDNIQQVDSQSLRMPFNPKKGKTRLPFTHPPMPWPPNPKPASSDESTGSLKYIPQSPTPEPNEMEVLESSSHGLLFGHF